MGQQRRLIHILLVEHEHVGLLHRAGGPVEQAPGSSRATATAIFCRAASTVVALSRLAPGTGQALFASCCSLQSLNCCYQLDSYRRSVRGRGLCATRRRSSPRARRSPHRPRPPCVNGSRPSIPRMIGPSNRTHECARLHHSHRRAGSVRVESRHREVVGTQPRPARRERDRHRDGDHDVMRHRQQQKAGHSGAHHPRDQIELVARAVVRPVADTQSAGQADDAAQRNEDARGTFARARPTPRWLRCRPRGTRPPPRRGRNSLPPLPIATGTDPGGRASRRAPTGHVTAAPSQPRPAPAPLRSRTPSASRWSGLARAPTARRSHMRPESSRA